MKPYEFKRFYHPKLSKFVYKHKGSGVIVDNIFKPIKKLASNVFKTAKPIAKKKIQTKITKEGEKLKKKTSEKAGDIIMKKLHNIKPKSIEPIKNNIKKTTKYNEKKQDSNDIIINRLISGNGLRR